MYQLPAITLSLQRSHLWVEGIAVLSFMLRTNLQLRHFQVNRLPIP
ncbi:MAG TPA: hypothetical protein V6C85_13755 [Allocoleopsis sp.]